MRENPVQETTLPVTVERALARRPRVEVPADFAQRTAALAVAQAAGRRPGTGTWLRRAGWGPRLAAAGCVALTGALFALAPHAGPSFGDLRFDFELLLLAELGGLGYVAVRFRAQ